MGGRGIMRRGNEFFRKDVKIRSNRSKEEYPPPAIYHVSREIMVGRGLVGRPSCELQGVPRNI